MTSHKGRKKRDESKNDWGSRLLAVMKEKQLSIRDVARVAGVSSPSVIDSWIRSSTPGDLMAVNRLCKELNVSFRWLLTGENENPNQTPTLSEIFEAVPYFDGVARIRIERLVERKKK